MTRFRLHDCENEEELRRGVEDLLGQDGPCLLADNADARTVAFVRGHVGIRARLTGPNLPFLFAVFGRIIAFPSDRERLAVMLGHGHLPDGASRCNLSPCLETEVLDT